PISVEYETERQQRVLILLDVGRMMSSTITGLTKLDHAVNTALMLAFVAITKGDEVGLLAYADSIVAYAPSRRGQGQFRRITEEVVESRSRVLAMLQRRGVHTIDVPAEQLTVATIQRYLELKRRALL